MGFQSSEMLPYYIWKPYLFSVPAVAALHVLCFYKLNRSLLGMTENLYLAVGKPEVRTKINLPQLVLMSLLMYPLTLKYGILGAGIAAALPSALMLILAFNEAGKIIEESFIYIARSLLPGIAGSLIMVLAIELLHYSLPLLSPISMLASSVILGSSIYLVFLWLAQKELIYEIKELIVKE